jgi:nitric oxide reductase activation protein
MTGSQYWAGNDFSAFKLVSYQRSMANFVEILTGKNIPVKYATQGDSKTDGTSVIISSHIGENTLDSVVGLALHEASHILLTNFEYVRKFTQKLNEFTSNSIPPEDVSLCFLLLNFVEDRRIDHFIYSTSPGYRVYYDKMYERYFFSEEVDNILKKYYKTPTKDAYLCRIINLFNQNNDLNTLPALKDVYDVVDIENIGRLKSTRDSLKLAVEIYNLIKPHIVEDDPNPPHQYDGIDKQESFLRGKVEKKKLSKTESQQIQKISKLRFKETNIEGTPVLDLKLDINLVKSVGLGFVSINSSTIEYNEKTINEGIQLGKKLTKKLQLLNDNRVEKISYKTRGQLDIKRLPLFSSENNIFHTINQHINQQQDIHLSIDLSRSMEGPKFNKSLKLASALCYCSLKIEGFNFSLSFRTTNSNGQSAILINAFDSKKNTLKDIRLMKRLHPSGGTPEGVLLEYVSKQLPPNSYIFSITDGSPNYRGDERDSIEHTKKCVNKINKIGYKLVSFFVKGTYDKESSYKNFQEIYKKNGYFIDINNMNEVSKSINKVLLERVS